MVLAACDLQIGTPETSQSQTATTLPSRSTTTIVGPVTVPDDGDTRDDLGDDILLVEVQVIHVDDGDSLQVVMDGVDERVRLLGINAPERDECLGDASRDQLEALVGDAVVLGLEPVERDQFGRVLAHVFASDVYVNREQVANGLAIVFSDPNAFQAELIEAEQLAESDRVGMWAPDACGDRTDADGVEIVDIEPDPPGRDEDNLDGEYVLIANTSNTDVNLGGFVLRDESTANRYLFDSGFVLEAGAEVAVVSGCSPGSGELGWCADGPIWNNGGDSALLLDPSGRVVDHYRYAG
jgi:endonuclease YncB( thermonuclease family)